MKVDVKTLYRHLVHYMGGRVAVMALGFVSFPVFARVFTVAEYGAMALVLKIAAVATVFAKMGLQQSVLRFHEENVNSSDPGAAKRFYSTMIVGALLTAASASVLFAAAVAALPDSLVAPPLKMLLLFCTVLIGVRGLQSITYGFLRTEGRTKAFNVVDMATKAGTVALACAMLFSIDRSVRAVLLATTAVEGAAVFGLLLFFISRGLVSLPAFNWGMFRTAIVFSVPLISYEVAALVLESGDRILVQHFLGAQAVGYYSAAYNIANYVQESIMAPVNLAIMPLYMKLWVTEGYDSTRRFLTEALDTFIAVAGAILAVTFVTSRDVITILGSKKYEAAHELLPVLVMGLLVWAVHTFVIAGLLIHKRTGIMLKIITLSCAVKLILNVILLPRVGLQGAAVATLISYALLTSLVAYASCKVLPLGISLSDCVRYAMAAFIALWPAWINIPNAYLEFAVKSTAATLSYSAVLLAVHPRLRRTALKLIGRLRPEHRRTAAAAAQETV